MQLRGVEVLGGGGEVDDGGPQATDSFTSLTVAVGNGVENSVVRPWIERTYALERRPVGAARVADAVPPPVVALGDELGQRVEVRLEAPVERHGDHEVGVAQGVRKLAGSLVHQLAEQLEAGQMHAFEAGERAVRTRGNAAR